jgi:hypothetical protein
MSVMVSGGESGPWQWPIVAGIASGVWALVTWGINRSERRVRATSDIVSRLLEGDALKIENPEIQRYLSASACTTPSSFRSPSVLSDLAFFKAKSFVYRQLNMFDEILSYASASGTWPPFLRLPAFVEIKDWESYIIVVLRHPLHRSIIEHEQHIFGQSFRDFWKKHEDEILSRPADPFVW